jgi:hypothetical protein
VEGAVNLFVPRWQKAAVDITENHSYQINIF